MKYKDGRSFRQALETRIRQYQKESGLPIVRVRKTIAFERFLARLGDGWILKGGFALQLRMDRARTTMDIDLLAIQSKSVEVMTEQIQGFGRSDIGDYFTFIIRVLDNRLAEQGSVRYHVTAILDGRIFEEFHLDVGMGDPVIEQVDYLYIPGYLEFAEIYPVIFPCYPISQHIAEKFHAITRPRTLEPSRVKDLVDILLLAELASDLSSKTLIRAIEATFSSRNTHSIPEEFGVVPASWRIPYRSIAVDVDLPFQNLDRAVVAANQFINPVLFDHADLIWKAVAWKWIDLGFGL